MQAEASFESQKGGKSRGKIEFGYSGRVKVEKISYFYSYGVYRKEDGKDIIAEAGGSSRIEIPAVTVPVAPDSLDFLAPWILPKAGRRESVALARYPNDGYGRCSVETSLVLVREKADEKGEYVIRLLNVGETVREMRYNEKNRPVEIRYGDRRMVLKKT